MTEDTHDIPAHLMPEDDKIVAEPENRAEAEINAKVDFPKWVHTSEPEARRCPYCGDHYRHVMWASNVHDHVGRPVYDTSETDFIIRFVHADRPYNNPYVRGRHKQYCSPRVDFENITGSIANIEGLPDWGELKA